MTAAPGVQPASPSERANVPDVLNDAADTSASTSPEAAPGTDADAGTGTGSGIGPLIALDVAADISKLPLYS